MMGGMGRVFDGGYAEYTCVPASQVIAFHSELLRMSVAVGCRADRRARRPLERHFAHGLRPSFR
jgi:hypothetical protein